MEMARKQLRLTNFEESDEKVYAGAKKGFTLPVWIRAAVLLWDGQDKGGLSIKTVSSIMGKSRQTTFKTLNRLILKGLADRKRGFYFLTESGLKFVEQRVNLSPHRAGARVLFEGHFLRFAFPITSGVQPKAGGKPLGLMRGGWRVYDFKGWDYEPVSVQAYPHKIEVRVHNARGDSPDLILEGAEACAKRVSGSFANAFGLCLGSGVLVQRPHWVTADKGLKAISGLRGFDKIKVGGAEIGSDKTDPNDLEFQGAEASKAAENFKWLIENGQDGFELAAGGIKALSEQLTQLVNMTTDLVLKVQDMQQELERLKRGRV